MDHFDFHYLFIFDRRGKCLFKRFWNHKGIAGSSGGSLSSSSVTTSSTTTTAAALKEDERAKLVYGMLFSLKQLIPTLSPGEVKEDGIRSLSTETITLHALESSTGMRFALCTSHANRKKQAEIRLLLERMYSELYVDFVLQDPSYTPGSVIKNSSFSSALDKLLSLYR